MPKTITTPAYRALRETLRAARKAKGWSQYDLADMLGHRQTYVSKYEIGEKRLDIIELITIADALDLDIYRIIDDLKQMMHQEPE